MFQLSSNERALAHQSSNTWICWQRWVREAWASLLHRHGSHRRRQQQQQPVSILKSNALRPITKDRIMNYGFYALASEEAFNFTKYRQKFWKGEAAITPGDISPVQLLKYTYNQHVEGISATALTFTYWWSQNSWPGTLKTKGSKFQIDLP